MPMPSLKPLIDAANLAYQQIREPKEASYLHQLATSLAALGGYEDTSGNKKSALGQLAEMKLTGTTEEQNETLSNKLGILLKHSKDGSNFKALVEILIRCSVLASNPRAASTVAMQFDLLPFLITLQNELKDPKHIFFQELGVFFKGMETYSKDLLQDETLTRAKQERERLQDENLARATQERELLQQKHRAQLLAKEAVLVLQQRTLEKQLVQKTSELETCTEALEERQRLYSETRQQLEVNREQHTHTLQALEKSKVALIRNNTQLKGLLENCSLDLDKAQSEAQKLKRKVASLETDIKNGCADYIDTHLKPKDNQLKAVTDELQLVKSQLEHLQRTKVQTDFASTYNRHGVYGVSAPPNSNLSNPQLRPFSGARNTFK